MIHNYLYEPKLLSCFKVNIFFDAQLVEQVLDQHLIGYPSGIYSRQTGELLLASEFTGMLVGEPKFYYHDEATNSFKPILVSIEHVSDLTAPVYNAMFEPVITTEMLMYPYHFLADKPTYPEIGLSLIHEFVCFQVAQSRLPRRNAPQLWDYIKKYINIWSNDPFEKILPVAADVKESYDQYFGRVLTDVLGRLIAYVFDLIEQKPFEKWNLIDVNVKNAILEINVFEDIRIVEWMSQNFKELKARREHY